MSHITRRLFVQRTIPLGSLAALSPTLLSGDSPRAAPLAEPFDYPANVSNGDVTLGARLVSRKEVRKGFKDRLFPNDRLLRLSQDFTVVEVGFYPSDKKSLAVDLQAFRFVSGQGPVSAVHPKDAAFELIHGRPRDAPIQLAGKTRKNEHSNLYEDAISATLFMRGLPTEPMRGPRGGYLYFSVKRKAWKDAESLTVEYVGGEKPIKLILPVSE